MKPDSGLLLKHELVAQQLEQEIRAGELPSGERLPAEAALAKRFSVSRNTIRAALSQLGEAGLIATRSGKGSFVTFDGRTMDARLGWGRALAAQGVVTEVEVLNIEHIEDPGLAVELDCPSSRFIAIDRRRIEAGRGPISRELSRLPATPRILEALAQNGAGGSLTRLLKSAGSVPASAEQWVEVRRLDDGLARVLCAEPGSSYLWTRSVTRTSRGRLVEVVESYLDPARFSLHFALAGVHR